jgi:urate oxidase
VPAADHPHLLIEPAYGKAGVRALVTRPRARAPDLVRDLSFDAHVTGEFDGSYRHGENAAILPSDTLRRHILATAADDPEAELAALCRTAASRLMDANPAFLTITVEARELVWQPVGTHTYTTAAGARSAVRTGGCVATRGTPPALAGGVDSLPVLVTHGSAFTGFLRDPLTVQTDALDRPLSGTLRARWTYVSAEPPPAGHGERTVAALIAQLTDRPSNAVQQWVTAAGRALLDAVPELGEVALRFDSVPIAPLPAELAGRSSARAYEPAGAPLGITEIRVRRG